MDKYADNAKAFERLVRSEGLNETRDEKISVERFAEQAILNLAKAMDDVRNRVNPK